nr:MAG TPA: hypothetical protein [Bacteriophage sp.]
MFAIKITLCTRLGLRNTIYSYGIQQVFTKRTPA